MDIVRGVPRYTLEDYETTFRERHLVPGAVEYWAARKPDSTALIHAGTGQTVSWSAFDQTATALAGQLLRMGLGKGDFFATSLPFLLEHVFLEYACFKAGIVHAPLDLRLKPEEVIRSVGLIQAKAYAFLGRTPAADFGELGRAVKQSCPSVQKLIQFTAPGETIPGAVSASELLARAQNQGPIALPDIGRDDGAQVIFTTGSTGYPKPALLSHRSITCQNMCLGGGFGFGEQSRLLVNLPPSHVGGQTELLMSALFWGGSVVVLPVFDPAASLRAIHEHKVTLLGQIPAMFNLEWRLASYREYDLSSLEAVLYGGQQVARPFLERLAQMAPLFGTGLGLTEASGFCTYTRLDGTIDEIAASIGYSMPVYPLSIREPMREDGTAGRELPDSEVGHVCFKGPQTFLGYVGIRTPPGTPFPMTAFSTRAIWDSRTKTAFTFPAAPSGCSSPLATWSSRARWRTTFALSAKRWLRVASRALSMPCFPKVLWPMWKPNPGRNSPSRNCGSTPGSLRPTCALCTMSFFHPAGFP